jgi:hypothetical protein
MRRSPASSVSGARRRAGLLLPILLVAAACDNVQYGGSDVQIVPPPPAMVLMGPETDEETAVATGLPVGPVLFHLMRAPEGPLLIPIGELVDGQLRTLRPPEEADPAAYQNRFRETVFPAGGQFGVFRRGARVGTFTVQAAGPLTACGVPTVGGNLSVVAAAVDAQHYLAFHEGLSPAIRGHFNPPQITGPIRTYASILAERLILQAGLPRPRSWAGAQRELEPLQIMGGGHPEMSATYLVGDSLAVGPADPMGYSVFYIADYETARGYTPVFSEVRNYRTAGKGAPSVVDHLNWDGQDGEEVLVRVFGRTGTWYEAIGLSDGRWQKIWEGDRCEVR